MAALGTDQLRALTTAQIQALTTTQLDALTGVQAGALSVTQMAALKNTQIAALTIDQINGFGTTQLGAWNTSQLGALTASQIAYLSTTQIAGLSNTQVAGLKTSQLLVFTVDQLAAFTAGQVPALTTAGLAALSVAQANAFTAGQVAFMSVPQKMALTIGSFNYASPLVLDLDGDGVATLGIAAGVQFDLRADGQALHTGWVAKGDGLLALDRNGDGVINDGGELFGKATRLAGGAKASDGYAALSELDSNGDGVISSADAAYGALRVWVDGNSDGVSQADELKTLAQLRIASIATGAEQTLTMQNGNAIGLTSHYTSSDGTVHDSADVWFQVRPPAASPAAAAVSLQRQVSALSNALGAFQARAAEAPHAANPAVNAAKAAKAADMAEPAGADAATRATSLALGDALARYRAAQGLHGAAAALAGGEQRGQLAGAARDGDWFSVPKR